MGSVPRMTNEGTPFPGEPFVFPSYGNIGPPHIASLSLLGLTIGLLVWLFSTQVILNAASASIVNTFPQEHLNLMLILHLLHLQGIFLFHLLHRVKSLKLVT
jgi:hypothetical protein